jgi:hypothetical protein
MEVFKECLLYWNKDIRFKYWTTYEQDENNLKSIKLVYTENLDPNEFCGEYMITDINKSKWVTIKDN